MRVIPSICTFCGVGCGIGLRVENGRVIGVEPQLGHPVSQGQLCSKGWSSSFAIDSSNRLTDPLIKEHGRFRRASWDEALELVAEAFRTTWEHVFHSVEMAVTWGRDHCDLTGITAIGIDEIQWQRGHQNPTLA